MFKSHQHYDIKVYLKIILSTLLILGLSVNRIAQVSANSESELVDQIIEEFNNEETTEFIEEDVFVEQTPINLSYFDQILPYAQFVNYQYGGDGTLFDVQDIIMEYSPDGNGIFQVVSYTGNNTIAYIYQIRDSGLYELAYFNDYYVVEDLRYSADALDGIDSLVLPSNLTIGLTFTTGYNNESVRKVAEIIDYYTVGNVSFDQVLRIEESKHDDEGPATYNYYYAPNYGIIVIERIAADGSSRRIMQLVSTQGFLE